MPEHLRALIVILGLATFAFALVAKPAQAILGRDQFARQRNTWFALVVCAFVAKNLWVYAIVGGLLLLHQSSRASNKVALFVFLLFALPNASAAISGLGLINYFFELNHLRLLSLCVLLPAYFQIQRQPDRVPFGRLPPDKLLGAYLVLMAVLELRGTTVTDTLRQCLYLFLDIFLPYYVASRSLKTVTDFRQTLIAFIAACLPLAAVAVFEFTKFWSLYRPLTSAMGVDWPFAAYLSRSGLLRANGPVGNIPLGYVMVVALTFYLFLRRQMSPTLIRLGIGAALVIGLITPLSRGPWVGAVAAVVVYTALGKFAIQRLALLAMSGALVLMVASALPGGQRVVDLLPFIGTVEAENIDYRERLIENASIVISRNPLFGSVNYLRTPEMEELRTGAGIIDVVNTYVGIALEHGFVGLTLFVGFFASVAIGIYRSLRAARRLQDDYSELGRTLAAGLAGILMIIFTVSSITVIPVVYWSFAGLGVAYRQLVATERAASGNKGAEAADAATGNLSATANAIHAPQHG